MIMNTTTTQTRSPQEIVQLGEQIYFEKKDELEKRYNGQFAIIDVDSKDIVIDSDKLKAIQKAQKKHPEKLFYIVEIGNLKQPISSPINEIRKYAWPL